MVNKVANICLPILSYEVWSLLVLCIVYKITVKEKKLFSFKHKGNFPEKDQLSYQQFLKEMTQGKKTLKQPAISQTYVVCLNF